ncbi:MAG: 16S rRNA (adenine(1518)-N(6)/adenine(1519)-N(6))-dimethyltransferase RsmA [Alphaproteobacteria bacterium]|nr:16S rRNA (adenine(1518)-N(6)/adenine(1519)-N(6))-dimethyltransferase RsmA [Alphaproteobacteria bacterium]
MEKRLNQPLRLNESVLDQLPSLKELLIKHDLWAKKSLGQNFLLDPNITDRIVLRTSVKDSIVLEVGPGPGGLTRSLLKAGATHVFAIEKDLRCVTLLQSLVEASDGRLTVLNTDALKFKLAQFVQENAIAHPLHIVANLPYNIGTQLLLNWLKELDLIASMTLMFQKEVAERIVAREGTNAYGRLSIISRYVSDAKILFHLPPEAFIPAPKVTSSVIQLIPKSLTEEEKYLIPSLERVTGLAFGQRRKMLKSSLKTILSEEQIISLGIKPGARPEELPLEDFIQLAKSM